MHKLWLLSMHLVADRRIDVDKRCQRLDCFWFGFWIILDKRSTSGLFLVWIFGRAGSWLLIEG